MFVRKVTGRADQPDQPVPVIVEPLPGHSDTEVLEHLKQEVATEVEVVGPGFISAQLAPSRFAAVEKVAIVHRKPRKQVY